MRVGGGHSKGAGFERKTCERLSLWITDGQKRDCFWRSAMSGGRSTVALKRGQTLSHQAGDICSVAPEGHILTDVLFFELKHYRNIRLESFIISGKGPLAGWWKQACKQAKEHGREPVLIAKQNNMPILVFTHPKSMFNRWPVAHLAGCDIGLLDRILKEKFVPPTQIKKRTVLVFPGDPDLELH